MENDHAAQDILATAARAPVRLLFTVLVTVLWTLNATEIRLTWAPNVEPDVAGYRIHYGEMPGALDQRADAGKATWVRIENLVAGKMYCFQATCYNGSGIESDPSDSIFYLVPSPPVDTRAPIAHAQEVSTARNQSVGLVLTASDPRDKPLEYFVVTGPVHGDLSGTPPHLIYTPGADFIGTDGFSFTARNGQLESAPALVLLTVASAGDSDPPRITGVERMGQGVRLTWRSVPGTRYQVVFKSRLQDSEWISVSPAVTATGTVTVHYDSAPEGKAGGRYWAIERVVQ
jgi:hypothetical protein